MNTFVPANPADSPTYGYKVEGALEARLKSATSDSVLVE
jgi:hypothetical protein